MYKACSVEQDEEEGRGSGGMLALFDDGSAYPCSQVLGKRTYLVNSTSRRRSIKLIVARRFCRLKVSGSSRTE